MIGYDSNVEKLTFPYSNYLPDFKVLIINSDNAYISDENIQRYKKLEVTRKPHRIIINNCGEWHYSRLCKYLIFKVEPVVAVNQGVW